MRWTASSARCFQKFELTAEVEPWPTATLDQLTENVDAQRVPVRNADRRPGPYPYYGASGVIDHVDGFTHDGLHILVAEDGENLRTRTVPFAFLADGKYWVNNHVHALRARADADAHFIVNALLNLDISGYLTGSTQPKLTQAALSRIRIPAPPPPVQRQIGDLLAALHNRIELNRQSSATIETLVRVLFAKWFGSLDPEQPPVGWDIASMGDHIDVTRGLSYNSAGLSDDGVPLHCLDSIYEGGGYKYEGTKHYRGEYKDRHVVRAGDLLVTNVEQGFEFLLIGCPAIVPQRFGDLSLFSADLFRVRPVEGSWLTSRFLYLALKSPRLRELVVGYSNGTTVNHLAPDGLKRPRLAVPPADLVQQFDQIVQPLFAKQEQLQLERETLAKLRDVLLPKLMSGEIRLMEAENAVAEAG